MAPKEHAGLEALSFIRDGMIVGLGTGSTAKYFIDHLGEALREGRLKNIRGIPTSVRSAVDITVDGADEVGPGLNLIKGLGGALLREKLVAQNSRRLVIIVDESKKVGVLGTHSPLPVEVAQFSHEAGRRFLAGLGCTPTLRMSDKGAPFVTDNGNFIYDCRFARIDDPAGLEEKLAHRAGIVETGLFIGMADTVIIAGEQDVHILKR